jgi:hypothetical protein
MTTLTILKRGSRGDDVKRLQRLLNQAVPVSQLPKGRPLVADGDFGPGTQAAVIAFQHLQGLPADGTVGPKTWRALGVKDNDAAGPPAAPVSQPAAGDAQLGHLSAKYETGGRGPGTVSTGVGDHGGVSYGSYQMTSKNGDTVAHFVTWLDFPWCAEFAGLTPGSSPFTQKWKQIAANHPDRFQASQHAYIKQTHYDPLVMKIKQATGLDVNSCSFALQNVIWSTAVQHGPNSSIVQRALSTLGAVNPTVPDFESRLIKAIYAERGRQNAQGQLVYFSHCTPAVQQGVAQRFIAEQREALRMLANAVPA